LMTSSTLRSAGLLRRPTTYRGGMRGGAALTVPGLTRDGSMNASTSVRRTRHSLPGLSGSSPWPMTPAPANAESGPSSSHLGLLFGLVALPLMGRSTGGSTLAGPRKNDL
jgi:hypothetical protein